MAEDGGAVADAHKIDPRLKEWATPRQAEFIDAVNKYGSATKAAAHVGAPRQNIDHAIKVVKKRAALAGYAPGHWQDGVAAGYRMGKVTVQRGPAGVERVWERQHPDQDEAFERVLDYLETRDIGGRSPLVAAPAYTSEELLAVYPMGDPHFGMYAWARETGASFDLKIATDLTHKAIDHLVSSAPPAKTALLLNLGDFFHADNSKNQTPQSGNALDVDTREGHVIEVGIEALVYCIERLLEKHERVVVWNNEGNHDPTSSKWLAQVLKGWFRNNERVSVDTSPGLFKYLRFGKVLIGSHHGHGPKSEQLALIMAADRPEDWGQTKHRYWYVGHIHHRTLIGKEQPGAVVESFRTLAGPDAWHAGEGYRAGRDMLCIVHHRDHGEVGRIRFDISMWRQP